jgi:hypothetical protein
MNRMKLALAPVFVLLALPVGAQTNITGDWDLTIQSAQGTNSVQVTFKQDGSKISGIFKSPLGELPFQDGTLDGDDLKFAFSIPIQGQPLDITMTGKVDGASITGKAQFGGFGEGDWSAKRIESAAPAPAAAAATGPSAAPTVTPAAVTTTATGLTGKWDLTLKTQMGDVPVSADFSETDGKVTGTITGPMGSVDIAGTFAGGALKLDFTARTPQGDIPVTMSGELSGDDIVNGKAEFGGMGQGEWTAKRSKP